MLSLTKITSDQPVNQHKEQSAPNRPSRPVHWEKSFPKEAIYEITRWCLSAFMRLKLDVDIRWHAALPQGPKILAANHPTSIDPFYLLTLLSEPVCLLLTAAAFEVPFFGPYLHMNGHIPAVRSSRGATVESIIQRVKAGRTVAIFPEGALSPLRGGFHQPHSGAARVALCTGAPVIPIGIGLQRARIRVIEINKAGQNVIGYLYTKGSYAITVGQALTFEGSVADHDHVRNVSKLIMSHIRTLAHESENRIPPVCTEETVPGLHSTRSNLSAVTPADR